MPRSDAGVAASRGSPGDVDRVARLENVSSGNVLARLEFVFAAAVELAQLDPRRDLGLGVMAAERRRDARDPPASEAFPHRGRAVRPAGPHPSPPPPTCPPNRFPPPPPR